VERPKASATVDTGTGFSRRRLWQNGECFESFCGNVRSGALEFTAFYAPRPRGQPEYKRLWGEFP
jgi:hypothetical protein